MSERLDWIVGAVLVVDPDADRRAQARRWLAELRYHVLEADNGDLALRMAFGKPDVVLIDGRLSSPDAFQLADRLRNDPNTSGIPVLIRCPEGFDEVDEIAALDAGASMCLPEPVSAKRLAAAVRALVRSRDQHRILESALSLRGSGTYEWAIDTGMVRWSESLETMHGLAPGEFASTFEDFQRFVAPHEVERVQAELTAAVEGDGEYRIVYEGRRADGSALWIQGHGKVFSDAEGRPATMLGVAVDVSDREMTARRLRQVHLLAAELNEAETVGDVLNIMDHLADDLGLRVRFVPRGEEPGGGETTEPVAIRRFVGGRVEIRAFADEAPDRPQVKAIGDLVTDALRRAIRSDDEREQSATLQKALLPSELPQPEGWRLEAGYQAAEGETRIGGDFYGAVEVDDRLVVFVGDVVGHGLTAVSRMGSSRNVIRALAFEDQDPANVLGRAADLLCEDHEDWSKSFLTVAMVSIDLRTGEYRAASAGHLPGVLFGTAGASLLTYRSAPPLGSPMARGVVPEVTTGRLDIGDGVAIFTDGLVERRDESLDEGLERLRARIADLGDDVQPDVILGRASERLNDDDRAVVIVRRT